jgi:hypothetical protein
LFFYELYNRAKGYNVDTSQPDQVTVTEGFDDGGKSLQIASLAKGEECVILNFDSFGRSLVIRVFALTQEPLGKLDFADLLIFICNDNDPTPCTLDHKVQCKAKPCSILNCIRTQTEMVKIVWNNLVHMVFELFVALKIFMLLCILKSCLAFAGNYW